MNPLVSIIMPVYNAKDYLEKAVRSVSNQTYKNLEILLIVDGATDGSGDICERLGRGDTRITVIHQPNGGICNARNHGLRVARGKYIAFCDHDDEMLPECIERAVSAAEESQSQLVKFTYRTQRYVQGKLVSAVEMTLPDAVHSVRELPNNYALFCVLVRAMWNGLYRRDSICEQRLRFDESVKYGMEDFLFNLELFPHIAIVRTIPSLGYLHYARVGQSTDEKFSADKMEDIIRVAGIERDYLLNQPGFREDNWVEYQINYHRKYFPMLFHPDNPMNFHEKCSHLKVVNTPNLLGLRCGRKYVWRKLFHSPKGTLRTWLFDMKLYSPLVIIDSIYRRIQFMFAVNRGGVIADSSVDCKCSVLLLPHEITEEYVA